ncbi:MAG TPA: glutathione S-transferase family protein [Flavobacteriaceae bacterium]|nr:glutathione S-transferase family protein [Flavobacteriaceae bacterium]
MDISPTGKVPVLKVSKSILFESGVINEYLDEAYGIPLHPKDLIEKAHNRAWMEYINSFNIFFFQIIMAKDKEAGNNAINELKKQFLGLEKVVKAPWFNGENYSMVDVSVAPIFVRLSFVKKSFDIDLLDELPKCRQWSDHLLERQSVIESVVDGFNYILLEKLKANESWLIT